VAQQLVLTASVIISLQMGQIKLEGISNSGRSGLAWLDFFLAASS